MSALQFFLQKHAGEAVLDETAMENLNALVRPALAAWPALQEVLEAKVQGQSGSEPVQVYPWTVENRFDQPLSEEQVGALTRQLMLQVCSF